MVRWVVILTSIIYIAMMMGNISLKFTDLNEKLDVLNATFARIEAKLGE